MLGFFLGMRKATDRTSYIGVFQVYLAEVDWYETRVVGEHLPEDALERPPEAHRLHGG